MPLPRLIYEGHKDIIALVTYGGGSEVPHAESCSRPGVCCCPLCCSRPQAIEGNTWAVFHMMPASARGGGGGEGGGGAVLLMGHLDVWAYVIQSQRTASNRPPIAGIQLRGDRSAASLLHPGGRGSGNRSRQGPEASLSPSTSPSPNTHTHTHTNSTVLLPLQLLTWPWSASGEPSKSTL